MDRTNLEVSTSGTLRKTTLRGIISLLLLLLTATSAWAADYVIMSNGNYYNGTAAGTTIFNPNTCIWTGNSGGTFTNGEGKTLSFNYQYYGYKTTTQTSASNTVWTINGNSIQFTHSEYNRNSRTQTSVTRSITFNNGWQLSTTQANTCYQVTKPSVVANNDGINAPTISCSGLSGNAGLQMTRTGVGGSYIPAHSTYNANGNVIGYNYNNTFYSSTDAFKVTVNESDATSYTWSITDGNASITNTGVLTLTNNTSGTITVRCRAVINGVNKDATYTLTTANIPALNETAYGDVTITPSAQTLDLGETVTYTASASINQLTRTRPQYVTITDQDGHTHYKVGDAYQAAEPAVTETPGTTVSFTSFNWSAAEGTAYFTIDPYYSNSSNQVTLTRSAQKTGTRQTFTISVTGQYGSQNKTASATVTIPATQVDLTALHAGEAVNLGMGSSASINGHYTYEPNYDAAGAPYLNFRYTSNNTNVATVDASGNVAAVGPGSTTITITAVKLDGTDGVSCNVTVNVAIDPPTITIDGSGNVTITHPVPGVQIRYTTNGTDPTATTGTEYTDSFSATNQQTIKAIAVANGVTSAVASEFYATSGISGNRVILNDYEDHTMSYYSAKPDADYPDVLLSPDPRNVKITYRGGSVPNGSAVAVSATESANEFVYYKTIEKTAWGNSEGRWLTGNYAYMVIPNPFSKRPKVGSTYYGFAGWKIISGGEYINGKNNNDVLGLEEKINFVNLDNNYTPNCTSAEIVFEATWTAATVKQSVQSFTGGTYETNFVVLASGSTNVTGIGSPMTIMGCNPDGTSAGTATISGITGNGQDLKIENIGISGNFSANSGRLIVGRGCTGTVSTLNSNGGGKYRMRIESGFYNFVNPMSSGTNSDNNPYGQIVFGSDYDRATNDGLTSNDQYTDNSGRRKLWVKSYVSFNGSGATRADSDHGEWMDITVKSGYFGFSADFSKWTGNQSQDGWGLGIGGNTDNYSTDYVTKDINGNNVTYRYNTTATNAWQKSLSFYCGRTRGGGAGGVKRILIEGGEFANSINGGGSKMGGDGSFISTHIRVRGGWLRGAIYGTASISNSVGSHKIVITGGEVNGWVAGGCNGTDFSAGDGKNDGICYIYVGGKAELRSHNKDGVYNNAHGLVFNVEGGNIYGAGRGLAPGANNVKYCGSTTTAYVVVSDEAFVEQNVYGGGYNGVSQSSHVYILGGTVGKNVFGGTAKAVSEDATWRTGTTDIRMYDGLVKGGIYGGHDETGKQFGTASVKVYGGQVGADAAHPANIHGGGLGQQTFVNNSVDVMIGESVGTDREITIYGDVYGGSALGSVNGTTASDTYHTNVTMNAGTVNGSIYGGGLGQRNGVNGATSDIEANVYGPVTVMINGGALKATSQGGLGAVFGCNNANGQPKRKVNVDVNGGEMEWIYGGGNAAPYTVSPSSSYDNFHVLMTAGHVKHSVFGGGLGTNAVISGSTEVKIIGPAVIDKNVYGGGNGGEVTGDTHVVIGE